MKENLQLALETAESQLAWTPPSRLLRRKPCAVRRLRRRWRGGADGSEAATTRAPAHDEVMVCP